MKAPPTGYTTEATLVRVIDGDTAEIEIRKTVKVRLLDCWCSETRTKDMAEKRKGMAAKKAVANLYAESNGELILHIPTHKGDISELFTLGRTLGIIWADPEKDSINERMVADGFATKHKP